MVELVSTDHNLVKSFNSFKGLDLRVSDLLRENGSATEMKNCTLRSTGALSKRNGWQYATRTKGGLGASDYVNVTTLSSTTVTKEQLTVDNNMYKLVDDFFTITYTGSTSAYFDMLVEASDNNFYFNIYEDGAIIYNRNLGNGLELSFVDLATLISEINALTDFSCSSTGVTTEPAAFIPVQTNITIESTGTNVDFVLYETVTIPNGSSAPFATHYSNRNNTNFENASFASVNDVLYIASTDPLKKYDGNRVYNACIPSPSALVFVGKTAGALSGAYKWKYTYEYIDAKGNIIESNASAVYTDTLSSEQIEFTLSNLQNTTGYNTDQGTIDATATANPITLAVGHTIKAGDSICILNNVTSDIEVRKVLSTTTTSATFEGAAISVVSGDIVSAGLKINLWRTQVGGSIFYRVASFANDGTTSTFNYIDNIADGALKEELIEPSKPHSVAPTCKYIDVWRGTIVLTGRDGFPNHVYYADIDSNEYFPDPDNSFIVESPTGAINTAIKSLDNTLYIFKDDSIGAVTGELDSSFAVDIITKGGLGCKSHNTIQEIQGRLWFLGQHGVYSIVQNQVKEESSGIEPIFKHGNTFSFNRAISYHWVDNNKFILILPTYTNISGELYIEDITTRVFVYDTYWGAWLEWSNFDISGGITEDATGNLYFIESTFDSAASAVVKRTRKVLMNSNANDYADHTAPISFTFRSHWEAMGEPSIWKKFLRIKVFSLDITAEDFEASTFVLTTTTQHDYDTADVTSLTQDFSGGASGWGNSPWGDFPWGENRIPSIKSRLLSRKAKSIRISFANNILHENILISGYELEVTAPFQARLKE